MNDHRLAKRTKKVALTLALALLSTFPAGALADAGGVPAQIRELQTAVQAQSVQITNLQTSVTALQTNNAALQSAVASLQSSVTAIQGQIAQLQTKDGLHDAALASLQARLAALTNQACPPGQFVTGITSTGALSCSSASDHKHFVRHAFVPQIGIPDDALYHTVVQLNVPAGKHVVHFNGFFHAGAREIIELDCEVFAVHNLQSDLIHVARLIQFEVQEVTVAMLARATLVTAGAILVKCKVPPNFDNAYFFSTNIVAWPVDDFL